MTNFEEPKKMYLCSRRNRHFPEPVLLDSEILFLKSQSQLVSSVAISINCQQFHCTLLHPVVPFEDSNSEPCLKTENYVSKVCWLSFATEHAFTHEISSTLSTFGNRMHGGLWAAEKIVSKSNRQRPELTELTRTPHCGLCEGKRDSFSKSTMFFLAESLKRC